MNESGSRQLAHLDHVIRHLEAEKLALARENATLQGIPFEESLQEEAVEESAVKEEAETAEPLWFKKCAVTGGNGFLATHIVAQLLDAGTEVVATVRNPTEYKVAHLKKLAGAEERLTIVDLDLTESDAFEFTEAFQGCEVLMHTASPFPQKCEDEDGDSLLQPAVVGTKKVLAAAIEAKLQFCVLTSSSAAVSVAHAPNDPAKGYSDGDWSDSEKLREWGAWYPLSKTLAEKGAWEVAEEGGLELCTVCPCQIFGPLLQPGLNTSSSKIANLLNGTTDQIPNSYMAYVDVRDVAALHIAAAANPSDSGGQRLMAVAGSMLHSELCDILRELRPNRSVPTTLQGTVEGGTAPEPPAPPVEWDISKAEALGVSFYDPKTTFESTVMTLPTLRRDSKLRI